MTKSKNSPRKKVNKLLQAKPRKRKINKTRVVIYFLKNIIGKLFILIGIACLAIALYFIFERINPNRLKFNGYTPEAGNSDSAYNPGTPKYLIIKDLSINLKVFPSKIVNNRWETTYDGVSFLTSSSIPGTYGNSIFYGHNWKSLLGNLVNAKPGQILEIVSDSGKSEKFVITTIQVVSPNDKSILDSTKDERITLYTCIGFLDSKRLVVTAIKASN